MTTCQSRAGGGDSFDTGLQAVSSALLHIGGQEKRTTLKSNAEHLRSLNLGFNLPQEMVFYYKNFALSPMPGQMEE